MKGIYIVFIGLWAWSSCTSTSETPPSTIESEEANHIVLTKNQFESSGYELGSIQKKNFLTEIHASGMIDLPEKNKYVISSYLGGVVNDMNLINGQRVSKGQVLFRLTNPELITWQQEYIELQGQHDFLKDEYQRQKTLAEENLSARKNYLKAEADLKMNEAKIAGLEKKLELLGFSPSKISTASFISSVPVVASTSGYVSDIAVVKGEFLQANQAAMTIYNTDHLHLELKVLERDFRFLKLEQPISFKLSSDTAVTYLATVHQIEPLVDDHNLINIHCHLEEKATQKLIPGMYVNAEINIGQKEVLALPENAVISIENKDYILLKLPGTELKFRKTLVEKGMIKNGWVEILQAEKFSSDDQFLTKGAYYLVTGG